MSEKEPPVRCWSSESGPERNGQAIAMKLLLYSKVFWPSFGGVETYARLLADGLAAQDGWEVTVATATPGPPPDPDSAPKLMRTPGLRELLRLIRDADVVLLAGPAIVPLALSLACRKPVAIEHHGYEACCPNGLLFYQPDGTVCPERYLRGEARACLRCNWKSMGGGRATWRLASMAARRWMCRHATRNICITEHVAKRLRLPASQVIYHGIPAHVPVECESRKTDSAGPVTFGYIGRITKIKGLPVLLRAAALLKAQSRDFRLLLVGDGPDREEVAGLAEALGVGDRLAITGFLSGEELQRAVARVDVSVMPSIWEETAGLAAMEQMLRARPVIASDIGGLGEIVGDAGPKSPPNDPVTLADQMAVFLDDREMIHQVGQRCAARARSMFRLEQMIGGYASALEEIGRNPRPAGGDPAA